ncbi:MAG TPA: hypothetical protein VJR46_07315 [Candidatus Dormibacteraeota bacterium]|nr:hypothetical protein [Candidatus Dormibacteraeota bacterium]
MIDPKDVVLAILGASTAFAGFVLVFLGIVLSNYESYSGAVSAEVKRPYRTMAVVLFTTFCLALGTVAVCIGWVLSGGGDIAYRVAIGLFLVLLLALLGAAAWTLRLVLEWP